MLSIYPACFYHDEDGYLYALQHDGEPVPAPSPMDSIDPIAFIKGLDPDTAVGEAFVNMVSVDVDSYAKKHFEKSVKKKITDR